MSEPDNLRKVKALVRRKNTLRITLLQALQAQVGGDDNRLFTKTSFVQNREKMRVRKSIGKLGA